MLIHKKVLIYVYIKHKNVTLFIIKCDFIISNKFNNEIKMKNITVHLKHIIDFEKQIATI